MGCEGFFSGRFIQLSPRRGCRILELIIFFRQEQASPKAEQADRKPDADHGKGTTRMGIGHVMRKGIHGR
jgi:hypothetical protein